MYSCILPNELYVGSAPDDEDIAELKKIGIKAVLDLTETTDGYAANACIKNEFDYVHYPLKDVYQFPPLIGKGCPPTLNQIHELCNIMRQWQNEQKPIFVHCRSGANRSPLICMAYLAIVKRMKLNKAIGLVSMKHEPSKPNAHQLKAL